MSTSRKRLTVAAVVMMFLFFCVASVFCIQATAADDLEDVSFYKLASCASAHMTKRLGDNKNVNISNGINAGNAGGLVGYCDDADTDGIVMGWINSALSNSSASFSYDSLSGMSANGGTTDSLYAYCRYGYLLSSLGLDSTGTDGWPVLRFIVGGIMWLLYMLAFSVSALFSVVISVLKFFNPFRFFADGFQAIVTAPDGTTINNQATMNAWGLTGNTGSGSTLASLTAVVSKLYNSAQSVSWAFVVPVSIAILLFTLLLFKNANRGSKVKKTIIRLVFLCIGVPVCGACYTMALDSMADIATSNGNAASRVVASTFCDFESWAVNRRLSPPGNLAGVSLSSRNVTDGDGGTPDPNTQVNVRDLCYYINQSSHLKSGSTSVFAELPSGVNSSSVKNWNSSVIVENGSGSIGAVNTGEMDAVIDMLSRYMSGSFIYASDWETRVKAKLIEKSQGNDTYYNELVDEFSKSDSADDFDNDGWNHFDGTKWGSSNLWANGTLQAVATGTGVADVVTMKPRGLTFSDPGSNTMTYVDGVDPSNRIGLSTMSMYNYLTSKFTKSSVVVYSSEKASSGLVRESHYSVNLVGNGIMQVLYYLNAIVLILSIIVIGWFYAISIMIANIKRTLRLITSVPFAVMGSIRSIAKVITYTLVMILEIVVTIFVYSLVVEIMMNITELVEGPFASALNNIPAIMAGAAVMGGAAWAPAISIICLVFGIVILIAFVIMAMRLRKVIVKSLDEGAAEIVNKFLDVNNQYEGINKAKEPGIIHKAAGNVARGVGMGIGNNIATSGMKTLRGMAAGNSAPTATWSTYGNHTNSPGSSPDMGQANPASADAASSMGGSMPDAGGMGTSMAALPGGTGPDGIPALPPPPDNEEQSPDVMDNASFDGADDDSADRKLADQFMGNDVKPDNSSENGGDGGDGQGADAPAPKQSYEPESQGEADTKAQLDNITGKTDAMDEERNAEEADKIKREERKEAAKKLVKGIVETAEGAAKIAAGASTGDVNQLVGGAQKLEQGTQDLKSGGKQAAEASSKANAEVNNKQLERNKNKPSVVAGETQGGSSGRSGGKPDGNGGSGYSRGGSSHGGGAGRMSGTPSSGGKAPILNVSNSKTGDVNNTSNNTSNLSKNNTNENMRNEQNTRLNDVDNSTSIKKSSADIRKAGTPVRNPGPNGQPGKQPNGRGSGSNRGNGNRPGRQGGGSSRTGNGGSTGGGRNYGPNRGRNGTRQPSAPTTSQADIEKDAIRRRSNAPAKRQLKDMNDVDDI